MKLGPLAAIQPASRLSAVLAASCFAGCAVAPVPSPPEELYYSRNGVELLAGIEPDAPVNGVLQFDTQAQILETHRSYVRIRTASQLEGWVPRDLLINDPQRRALRLLTRQCETLPNQGLFRSRDTLNVHVEPYRWSPTFYQLTKDQGFQVLDRMLVDRLPAAAATSRRPPAPTGQDHWYLVRVPEINQAGWLIGNMAYADIPLEVARLAQGLAINAYFAIGAVHDESLNVSKPTWLWVQSERRDGTHDFDRLLVFQWNSRLDRYSIIRRDSRLTGYLPIETVSDFETQHGTGTGFRVLIGLDGKLHERTYAYVNNRVYHLGEEPITGVPLRIPPGGFGELYRRPSLPRF